MEKPKKIRRDFKKSREKVFQTQSDQLQKNYTQKVKISSESEAAEINQAGLTETSN